MMIYAFVGLIPSKYPNHHHSCIHHLKKTQASSVGNDWKNWVVLQGNDDVVADDVTEVGKSIGVTFKGDKANMFSVLSKSGADKLVSSCSRQGAPALGEAGC
jgi:hypothetical protein